MAEQLLNLKFVREVEKRPCLYNYTIGEYSRRDLTENAWAEIGREVNLSGNECKEKWKNLRAVFVRHMKPFLTGTKTKPKKPYYLADAMQFALPYIKSLYPRSDEMHIQPQVEVYDEGESNWQPPDNEMSPPSVVSPQHSFVASPGSPQSSISPMPSSPKISQQSSKIIAKREEMDEDYVYPSWHQPYQNRKTSRKEVSQLDNEYFQSKRSKVDSIQHEANKMYLLSLLPDVDHMTPSQTRTFKRKVIDLIDNILQDTPAV
ncbi:uncharacterized protein LOC113511187 [Galleria mellonella]|uniref:Uncharacterized protein LOC113511187 n=1 Tax=Galleria mellonella TaxID=7137 RepID=A0A6J1WHY6_GALME|nr:uncharacterized protein LOC113511187 [Galleria mellonella]